MYVFPVRSPRSEMRLFLCNKTVFSPIILIISVVKLCTSMESDLTLELGAGKRECFHQYVNQGSEFEIEYQVIEGGDMDINFIVQSPTGRVVVTEVRKTDGLHKIPTEEAGDYMFCLDNTFSRFSHKVVFFEILTDDPDPDWVKISEIQDLAQDSQEEYEMKIDDFKEGLTTVKSHLDKAQQHQNILRVFEARDRGIQEDNFSRVNTWSGIQLGVMITVGLMQVILIRSLFEDRSRVGKILKMRT